MRVCRASYRARGFAAMLRMHYRFVFHLNRFLNLRKYGERERERVVWSVRCGNARHDSLGTTAAVRTFARHLPLHAGTNGDTPVARPLLSGMTAAVMLQVTVATC